MYSLLGPRKTSTSQDDPPLSRLFVICNREHTEDEIRDAFSNYGTVGDIWIVRDRDTGESKGVAYVKFAKTSDAAKAQEEMNGAVLGECQKSIKVRVASNKGEGKTDVDEEKAMRLFLNVPKHITRDEIVDEFKKYGPIENVLIVQDKITRQSKGFAYVKFTKFLHAAMAFENCPSKYKAVFAEPKGRNTQDLKRKGDEDSPIGELASFLKMRGSGGQTSANLNVICSNNVTQDQLWRIFDIVPGLDYCEIKGEHSSRTNEFLVSYKSTEAAMYAKEKIHGLEYPSGERMIIKFSHTEPSTNGSLDMQLSDLDLPPRKPMQPITSSVALRLYIVISSSLSQATLQNIFCRFGNLIEVYMLPNRNCGYAKYSNYESATNAMSTLNGFQLGDTRFRVMEAEAPRDNEYKRVRTN